MGKTGGYSLEYDKRQTPQISRKNGHVGRERDIEKRGGECIDVVWLPMQQNALWSKIEGIK